MNSQLPNRMASLRAELERQDIDSLLVFGPENIRYLSGFGGHAAYLVIDAREAFLITDYRYAEQARTETAGCEVVCRDRDAETLGHCINRFLRAATTVAFEAANVDVAAWTGIREELAADRLVPVSGMVESLRQVKDDWEIAQISAAAAIADQSLGECLPLFRAGVSERDLALELEFRMQRLGSEGMAFDTILLFGERTSMPHGVPSGRRLQPGDFVTLDFGAVVNGYRSDMTRSYIFGGATAQQIEIYETVAASQAAALERVVAGALAVEALVASRSVLDASPFAAFAGEGLGHGVGLFIHEPPIIKPGCDHRLAAGNVITVEPGIYVPGLGGVRLEDDVLVTASGRRQLTNAPKPMLLPG